MSTQHYSPSQAITDAHNLPRWGGASNLVTPAVYGSAFIASLSTSPAEALRSNTYLLGVLAPGAALIAAGVLVFVIFCLAFWCVVQAPLPSLSLSLSLSHAPVRARAPLSPRTCSCACCRCCGACRPRAKASASCSLLSRTTALLLIGGLNLGLLLSALAYVPGFGAGLGGIVGSMQSVAALMTAGAALLTAPGPASVASQAAAAGATAARMAAAVCANAALSPQYCSVFSDLPVYIASLAGGLGAPAGVLTDAAGRLTSSLASWPVAQIQGTVTLAGLCVLAVVSGLLFLQSTLLCQCRCASYSFKLLSFVSLLLVTLVYVLAGVFLVVGMLGSDVCFSPYAQLASLSAPIDPTLTLNYYLTCYGSSAAPPSGSVPASLLNVSAATAQFSSALNASVFQNATFSAAVDARASGLRLARPRRACTPPPNTHTPPLVVSHARTLHTPTHTPPRAAPPSPTSIPGLSANGTVLLAGFTGIATTLGQLPATVLSCSALDGVFSAFFNGLCGGAINSSVNVARIMIAAASLLLLQLALMADFSCYHPGDPTAFGAAGSSASGGHKDLQLRSPAAAQQQRNVGYTV